MHYIWIFGHISDFSKHFSKKALTLWIPVHCQVMILRQLLLSKVWNISLSSFLRSLALKRWLELSGDRRLDKQIFVSWNISKYNELSCASLSVSRIIITWAGTFSAFWLLGSPHLVYFIIKTILCSSMSSALANWHKITLCPHLRIYSFWFGKIPPSHAIARLADSLHCEARN